MKKILFITLMGLILLIGSVSAVMEWDNSLDYKDKDMKVVITNWLGLGEKIGEATLKSHSSIDEIIKVPQGESKVMYYDFNFSEEYESGLGKVTFIDLETGKKINKDYHFEKAVYREEMSGRWINCKTENSVKNCDYIETGLYKNLIGWEKLENNNIPKGEVRIALVTNVNKGDLIDGVWTIAGKKVSKHASWTEQSLLAGLYAGWTMNETSGSTANDVLGTYDGTLQNMEDTDRISGVSGNGLNFDGGDEYITTTITTLTGHNDYTISFWFNTTSTANFDLFTSINAGGIPLQAIYADFASADGRFYVRKADADGNLAGTFINASVNDGKWHLITIMFSQSNDIIIGMIDGVNYTVSYASQTSPSAQNLIQVLPICNVLGDSGAGICPDNTALDEVYFWSRRLNNTEVSDMYNTRGGYTDNFAPSDNFPIITPSHPLNNSNWTSNAITFSSFASDDKKLINVSLYLDGTRNQTNTSGTNGTTYNWTIPLADGTYDWYYDVWDNATQVTTSSGYRFYVDLSPPTLGVYSPTGTLDSGIVNGSENLNWSVNDTNLDTCWYNYNFTNTTVTCTDNHTTFTLTSQRNITFWANDSFGFYTSSYNTWSYIFFETSQTYSAITYETSPETFSINFTYGSSAWVGVVANLNYNGTNYTGTQSGTGDDIMFSVEIDIPIVVSQENRSFYWIIALSNSTGTFYYDSSSNNQTVNPLSMGLCDGTLIVPTLNFTAWHEENLSRLIPYDFYGTFEYWVGEGNIKKNFSISNSSVNYTAICINVNKTFYADAIIQYEKTGYVKRNYYLINESLTNVSQEIELILLPTTRSATFIIDVIDNFQFSIDDAYIHIQRYYPGLDEYKVVEMALTDDSGSTVGHFEAETEDYRIIIEKDNSIIYQSGTQKIFCRETPCTLTFQTEAEAGITWEDFGTIDQFEWTLDFDNNTNIFTFTYSDTSGSIGHGRLYVYNEDPSAGKVTICNITSTSIAATLTCDVTNYNGTIYGAAYLSRSPEILVYLKAIVKRALKDVLGLEGLFLSMFVLLVLGLIGLWNPAVGIVSIVGGMVILNFMGLASFGAVTIWGIVFIAMIILWELKS